MFSNEFLILEFGYSNIKLMVVLKENRGIRIKRMDFIPVKEGSIIDGKIMNVDHVTGQLSNYLIQNNIRAKKTLIVLTSAAMLLREAEVLNHKRPIINSFIKLEAKNHFPVDLSECIVDYKIIPDHLNDAETEEPIHKILMVAIPSGIIQNYISIAKSAGLRIHAIDISSDCITELFAREKKQELPDQQADTASTAFIDIGSGMTNVTIVTNGFLKYNKVISFGVSYLTHAVTINKEYQPAEADEERKNRDLFHDYINESTEEGENLIKVILNDFLDGLETFFSFHGSRKTGNRIDRIVLIGGGAYQKGMKEILEDYFSTKVDVGFEFDNVILDPKMKDAQKNLLCFYNGIGASFKI